MAVRPSSDDKSDFDEDQFDSENEEDVLDEQDSDKDQLEDEESEDESVEQDEETNDSATFVAPLLSNIIPIRKSVPVSNGESKQSSVLKKTALSNEVIICDTETLNGASNSSCSNLSTGVSGRQSADFDPLNVDEKDPLDIDETAQTGDSDVIEISDEDDDESNTEEDLSTKVSLPIIKINRISGAATEDSWKIKSKLEVQDTAELPSKRVRPTRQAASFTELEVDELPARKGSRLRQPVTAPNTSPITQQPAPLNTRRGRRKRTDSEDSFEIMPFKRRQFKSVEKEHKEDSKDHNDVQRTSTPTPNENVGRRGKLKLSTDTTNKATVATASRLSARLRGAVEQQIIATPKADNIPELIQTAKSSPVKEQPQERLNKLSNSEEPVDKPVDKPVEKPADISMESLSRKRGRPKKNDGYARSNASFDATSRDSFAAPTSISPRRKIRSSINGTFDEDSRLTNSTFDNDDSNMDLIEIGDMAYVDEDGNVKTPRRPQARPGPVKNNLDIVFPRLTADELESARETGWQCKVCGRKLANQWSLDTHFTTVHGTRTFTCDICDKAFKRKDHLINHKRSIHLVRTKDCRLCDLSFKRKTELVAHMKLRHPKSAISTAEVLSDTEVFHEDSVAPKRGRKKKSVDQLSPNEMDRLLSSEKVARKYRKRVQEASCFSTKKNKYLDECMYSSKKNKSLDGGFDSETGKKKRGRPRKVSFEDKDAHRRCPDCLKVFFKASQLPAHKRAWHEEQECPFCYSVHAGSQRLEKHLEDHRSKQEDDTYIYLCTMCPGRFTKEVCLVHHARDFHREEHCLACGSCISGSKRMQIHVAEQHAPEKMIRDVLIHGYDSPDAFYQCSHCPRSFYEFYEAEHHFLVKHVTLGNCAKKIANRQPKTWWPWAQLYPELDIFADYRYFERELGKCRSSLLHKKDHEQVSTKCQVMSRKSSAPDLETMLFDDENEEVLYQCELCEQLFEDHDLLEEHLGHMHMATCFDFPDIFPDQWGFVKPAATTEEENFNDPDCFGALLNEDQSTKAQSLSEVSSKAPTNADNSADKIEVSVVENSSQGQKNLIPNQVQTELSSNSNVEVTPVLSDVTVPCDVIVPSDVIAPIDVIPKDSKPVESSDLQAIIEIDEYLLAKEDQEDCVLEATDIALPKESCTDVATSVPKPTEETPCCIEISKEILLLPGKCINSAAISEPSKDFVSEPSKDLTISVPINDCPVSMSTKNILNQVEPDLTQETSPKEMSVDATTPVIESPKSINKIIITEESLIPNPLYITDSISNLLADSMETDTLEKKKETDIQVVSNLAVANDKIEAAIESLDFTKVDSNVCVPNKFEATESVETDILNDNKVNGIEIISNQTVTNDEAETHISVKVDSSEPVSNRFEAADTMDTDNLEENKVNVIQVGSNQTVANVKVATIIEKHDWDKVVSSKSEPKKLEAVEIMETDIIKETEVIDLQVGSNPIAANDKIEATEESNVTDKVDSNDPEPKKFDSMETDLVNVKVGSDRAVVTELVETPIESHDTVKVHSSTTEHKFQSEPEPDSEPMEVEDQNQTEIALQSDSNFSIVNSLVNNDCASLQPETNTHHPEQAPKIPSENQILETSHSSSIVDSAITTTGKINIKDCAKSDKISVTKSAEIGITKCLYSDVSSSHSETNNVEKDPEIADNSNVSDVSVFTQVTSHRSDVKEVNVVDNSEPAISNGISTEM